MSDDLNLQEGCRELKGACGISVPRCGRCGWPLQFWNLRCPCWVNRV